MTPDLQAKVDKIRERHAGNREAAAHDREADEFRVVSLVTWYDDIDTLLAALDAERDAVVAWLRKEGDRIEVEQRESYDAEYKTEHEIQAACVRHMADAIARGKHREGKGNG